MTGDLTQTNRQTKDSALALRLLLLLIQNGHFFTRRSISEASSVTASHRHFMAAASRPGSSIPARQPASLTTGYASCSGVRAGYLRLPRLSLSVLHGSGLRSAADASASSSTRVGSILCDTVRVDVLLSQRFFFFFPQFSELSSLSLSLISRGGGQRRNTPWLGCLDKPGVAVVLSCLVTLTHPLAHT